MQWDSKQYLQYASERTQPSIDLVNRINIASPSSAVDIGCGPGNSTAVLKSRFPEAEVLGLDNSENMLAKAKSQYGQDIKFEFCDVYTGIKAINRKFDVVFSNACLQWIPEHKRVLPELFGLLNSGGVLAVQIPKNWNSPLYKIMDEVLQNPKWKFNSVEVAYNGSLEPDEYFDILSELSNNFAIWETIYYHRMKSHAALIEWVKGTKLRPYLNLLNETDQHKLENEIIERLAPVYPVQANGEIIYKFRRLFFTVNK